MPVSHSPNIRKIEGFVSMAWGGGDGIYRGYGDEGVVVATTPASLSVQVGSFRGSTAQRLVESALSKVTAAVTPPTGGSAGDLRRIDLVQWTYGVGLNVKTGTESGTPAAPSVDANSFAFAQLHLRKGMASILAADDSSNGWIVDAREFR